jgi:hypothetical protein
MPYQEQLMPYLEQVMPFLEVLPGAACCLIGVEASGELQMRNSSYIPTNSQKNQVKHN